MKSNALLKDLKVAAVLEQKSNRSLIRQHCGVLRNIKLAVNEGCEGSCRAVDWQDIAAATTLHDFFGVNCLLFG